MIRYLCLFVVAVILALPRPAAAQLVVFDPVAVLRIAEEIANTAKIIEQTTTAATTLTDMSKGLGGLGTYRTVPILGQVWDTQGAMPGARIPQLVNAAELVAALRDSDAKRYLENQLAMIYVSARTQSHGLKAGLNVQTDAGGPLSAVINTLMGSILSGSKDEQHVAGILQKIAVAAGVQHHQIDGLTQVSIGSLNQLGVAQQRATNADVSQLNLGLTVMEQSVSFGESYITGSSDVLRNWRLH